jgi:hypothetical protein
VGAGFTWFSSIWMVVLFSVAIYLFVYHFRHIKADKNFYSIPVTQNQIDRLEIYLHELNWSILEKSDQVIVARTKSSAFFMGRHYNYIAERK